MISDPIVTPGFRFYPTEEELLTFYLRHRLSNTRPDIERVIPVLDVYSFHPSELCVRAGEATVRDTEQWFFFCPRREREVQGGRPARTTPSGYWKATGSPSYVISSTNHVIGVKRTMVFYEGRAPTGTKTMWKMNEYKVTLEESIGVPMAPPRHRNEFSVCRVYINTGTLRSFDRRPRNPSCNYQAVHQKASSYSNTNGVTNINRTENSHDSSSSGEHRSQGIVNDSEEVAAIDWDILLRTADFDFDFDCNLVGVWPQI